MGFRWVQVVDEVWQVYLNPILNNFKKKGYSSSTDIKVTFSSKVTKSSTKFQKRHATLDESDPEFLLYHLFAVDSFVSNHKRTLGRIFDLKCRLKALESIQKAEFLADFTHQTQMQRVWISHKL